MGIFGWSLPPGCSTLPGEEPCPQCEVCGGNADLDSCICEECSICGVAGDPDCYVNHGMTRTRQQITQKIAYDALEAEMQRREEESCRREAEEYEKSKLSIFEEE